MRWILGSSNRCGPLVPGTSRNYQPSALVGIPKPRLLRPDSRCREAGRLLDAMMQEMAAAGDRFAIMDGLLQRIENETRVR